MAYYWTLLGLGWRSNSLVGLGRTLVVVVVAVDVVGFRAAFNHVDQVIRDKDMKIVGIASPVYIGRIFILMP